MCHYGHFGWSPLRFDQCMLETLCSWFQVLNNEIAHTMMKKLNALFCMHFPVQLKQQWFFVYLIYSAISCIGRSVVLITHTCKWPFKPEEQFVMSMNLFKSKSMKTDFIFVWFFFQTFHYEDTVVKLPHSYKTSPPHSHLPEPLSLTQFDELLQTFLHSKLGQTDVSMLTQKIYRYADFNNNGQVNYLIFLYLTDNDWIYWFKERGLNPGQLLQPYLIVPQYHRSSCVVLTRDVDNVHSNW